MRKSLNVLILENDNKDQDTGEYLLKDIEGYDLVMMVMNPSSKETMSILPEMLSNKTEYAQEWHIERGRRILIEISNEKFLIEPDTILFAEVNKREITLFTERNTYRNIKMGLKEFVDYVGDPRFKQSHKAFAVNTRKITKVTQVGRGLWSLHFSEGEKQCPMTKTYYEIIHQALEG